MDYRTLHIDHKIIVARQLEIFAQARQAAYAMAKEMPEMRPFFDQANAIYENFAESINATAQPVFDSLDHHQRRVAEGHPAYVGTKPF